MANPSITETGRFIALDGLRGIAAISVLVMHVSQAFSKEVGGGAYRSVDLFFMLSGFVLAHAYEKRFAAGLGTVSFMRLRLIRLSPLAMIGTAVGAVLLIYAAHKGWSGDTVVSATIAATLGVMFLPVLPGLLQSTERVFPANNPVWSLFWELVINLFYSAIASRLTDRRLALLLSLGLVLIGASIARYGEYEAGPFLYDFWGGGARVFFCFFAGVGVFRYQARHPAPPFSVPTIAIFAVFALTILAEPTGWRKNAFDVFAVAAVFPMLIYFGATNTIYSKATRTLCDLAGRASYAVYVIQFPLIELIKLSYPKATGTNLTGIGALGIVIISTVVISIALLLDTYYDTPLRKFIARRSGRTKRRRANKAERLDDLNLGKEPTPPSSGPAARNKAQA